MCMRMLRNFRKKYRIHSHPMRSLMQADTRRRRKR